MEDFTKMDERKLDKILNRYSAADYGQFDNKEIGQLVKIAGMKGNETALKRIKDMGCLESRIYVITVASDAFEKVRYGPAMGLNAEDHSREDVSEIYGRINYASKTKNAYALNELKRAGMLMGHIGVVEYATQMMPEEMRRPLTSMDYLETLKGAIRDERGTLDDATTSLGRCYQVFFGKSYLELKFKRQRGDSVTEISYSDIPTEDKEKVDKMILGMIDFSKLEQTVREAEAKAKSSSE